MTTPLFFHDNAPVFESVDAFGEGEEGAICWLWDGTLQRFRFNGGWQPDGEASEVASAPMEEHPDPDENPEHGSNEPEEMDEV